MNGKLPHPIPYQGSKRNIANFILKFFPDKVSRLIEPFAGSAAITIATAYYNKTQNFVINDVNEPLMELWKEIINNPERISKNYAELWNEQLGDRKNFYFEIRDRFNKNPRPEYFIYLLARCVKASVRYNSSGEFNQSADNRRKGRNPKLMSKHIHGVSNLLKGRTEIYSKDFRQLIDAYNSDDLIYMDPPYQGTSGGSDSRYYQSLNIKELMGYLEKLNSKEASYILSYDGRTGEKSYGTFLPENLNLFRVELEAGVSTQATLLGKKKKTFESLYLSKSLLNKLDIAEFKNKDSIILVKDKQLALSI